VASETWLGRFMMIMRESMARETPTSPSLAIRRMWPGKKCSWGRFYRSDSAVIYNQKLIGVGYKLINIRTVSNCH
jgi:hypothetical protein